MIKYAALSSERLTSAGPLAKATWAEIVCWCSENGIGPDVPLALLPPDLIAKLKGAAGQALQEAELIELTKDRLNIESDLYSLCLPVERTPKYLLQRARNDAGLGWQSDPEFAVYVELHPSNATTSEKGQAYIAWKARIQEGVEPQAILKGIERYARYWSNTNNHYYGSRVGLTAFLQKKNRYWELPWRDGTKVNTKSEAKALESIEVAAKKAFWLPK